MPAELFKNPRHFLVSVQYSTLPSPVRNLINNRRATNTGTILKLNLTEIAFEMPMTFLDIVLTPLSDFISKRNFRSTETICQRNYHLCHLLRLTLLHCCIKLTFFEHKWDWRCALLCELVKLTSHLKPLNLLQSHYINFSNPKAPGSRNHNCTW